MNIFKKYKLDRFEALEESISRTDTIVIHWESIPYNSSITYISKNIEILGYSVLECVQNNRIIQEIRNIGENILLQRKVQSLSRNEYSEFEHVFKAKSKNGQDLWLKETTKIVCRENKIAYGETLLLNITNEKQIEEKIISSIETLEGTGDSLEYGHFLPKSIIDNIVSLEDLQEFQDHFFFISNCAGICFNIYNGPLTEFSGNPEVKEILINIFGMGEIRKIIYDTALRVSAENRMLCVDTRCNNVKAVANAVSLDQKQIYVWVMFFIMKDVKAVGNTEQNYAVEEKHITETLELLNLVTRGIQLASRYNLKYVLETKKRVYAETCTQEEKRRNEILAYIIQLLDSEQNFDTIVYTLLEVVGKYLKLSNTILFKAGRDSEFELVGEWMSPHSISYKDFFNNKASLEDLNIGTVAVNENEDAGNYKHLMRHSAALAMFSVPIIINGKPAMCAAFFDNKQGRNWDTSTAGFITDICRMLQSIIFRRITKNSLVSSYSALKEILDNIGSAIYVADKNTKQILFCNELLKKTCKQNMVGKYCWDYHYGEKKAECDHCEAFEKSQSFTEFYDQENEIWSEIRNNDITWVDGSLVSLSVITDVTEKKKYQKKIEFQANNDFLTGLYNRMRCEQDLAVVIQEAQVTGQTGAALFIDLDDFKHINDGLGHQYGDLLLKMIAIGLQQIKGVSGRCYRLGGDEFLIIVVPEEFKNLDYILDSIDRLFGKPWYLEDEEYYCTMSMGIVCFPKDGKDVNDLIKKADIAMYDAKNSGKNRYKFYNLDEEKYSYERLDIEKNLRAAAVSKMHEFEIYIQPIIDAVTLECLGGETLLRWNSSQLGFLQPGDFIPIAEHIGLITHIGQHVLREACKLNKKWSRLGREMKINVNLSIVQLMQNDIVELIEDVVKETGIKPENLVLEVTENLAINDMKRMKNIIDKIKALGIKIALDDFGTGYSSLSYIKQINFDIIKVDRFFIADIEEDTYARAFVKLITELSHELGIKICIEGVETVNQYNMLKEMKVSQFQGYYFGRPMPVKDFEHQYLEDLI